MDKAPLDVLVVGGGITGAGAALDAASRGLRTALVEQRDYGSGTSSRSSKMFHGGLRYLQRLELGLVREALRERNLMVNRLCPHLVEPTSFIYPTGSLGEHLYVGAGILLYEVLARLAENPMPWHRHLGRRGMQHLAPALGADRGVRYWDSVVDDARHTVTVARTAAANGALLASSARVTDIRPLSSGPLQIVVEDLESGEDHVVEAHSVINATGVWTDEVEALAGEVGIDVAASKGVHVVVPRDRIESSTGLILRTDKSVLFMVPWGDHWIIGTTDTPWDLDLAHPAASRVDIEYILSWANTALTSRITTADIVGVFAGLRPLLVGESDDTSRLSREHAVKDRGNGVVSVAGGKYTTYRVMAADAVDAIEPYLRRKLPDSPTRDIPLVGAQPWQQDRLSRRYGSMAAEVDAITASAPGWSEQLVPDAPYLRAEVVYGVTHEGALHLDDVLARRTHISIETRHRGVDAAETTAELMGGILGWDPATRAREITHYLARVAAELDSQSQPDDRTADAARLGAPDVRTGAGP